MQVIKTENLTKYYGKARGIIGMAFCAAGIAAAYINYTKKDIH